MVGNRAQRLRKRQRETRAALEQEERKSQGLLANVFPASIIPRLRAGEAPIADQFADVTVIFADVVEFTPLAERLGPKRTVLLLNELFRKFDQAALRLGVEKIETTGDGYLAVGGAPGALDNHAEAVALFALEVLEAARSTRISEAEHVQVRVGIHTGPVFAGVIGESRFHYKIFGETVNTASRIQALSQPGRVLVSEATYKRLQGVHRLQEHGTVDLKGHGPMRTYWLR
jgi:class 3 adenylate cyclase